MSLLTLPQTTFNLGNFEGPLEFLLHLVHKNEIEIYDIAICQITEQFLEHLNQLQATGIEAGAEFINTAAYLLWLKSKTLLPKHEQKEDLLDEELDPQFTIIHHLLDYCRFKQAAKKLLDQEKKQNAFYPRGTSSPPEIVKTMGIDHLTLEELHQIFREAISKIPIEKKQVQGETWRVADQIKGLRHQLKYQQEIPLGVLFVPNKTRLELITLFLAILELMKMGEIKIGKDQLSNGILKRVSTEL